MLKRASSLKPQASNQVRRFRSLLLESLEQRRVFAVDFNSLAASQIDAPAMSNSSQATYTPFQPPTFDLQQTQSTQSGPISPALSSKVAKAVGLSEQTFAPESTLQSFQNAAPNLNSVQPMLVGSGFGSQSDWSQVSSTKSVGSLQLNNSNSSQQVSSIATGGFASALMPKQSSSQTAAPVASVLSAEQYRGMQSQTVTGSYCTQDGRVVIVPRLGEGEPPADGSGNGGADDEPFIPQVDVPDLQSANGSLNSFTPSDASGSSTTMTLHGSFTAGSLTNPDFNADGINWVHVVTTNWIDENTWSFTETLILSYNLSASDSSSSDDEEDNAGSGGGSGDSSSNNGSGSNGSSSGSGSGSSGGSEDPEDELQVTSNWSSSASATRNGFIMYAFTASRGIASPSAAGVAWSVAISYSDRIHFELSANGGSSYTLGVPAGSGTGGCGTACHDNGNSNSGSNSGGPSGGGDGGDGDGDGDLPDNFQASANWDFSIGLDAHSNGTFNVSSTPSLAIATGIFGGIDRAISANITYDSGGAVDVGSNWSSSSSSGNLQPDHENPSDPCITCGGDSNAGSGGDPNSPPPLNPRGNFIGTGHMSASSGGSTGHTGGRSIGGLGALGTLNNSKWKNLVGDAHDNFHADAHGDGQAKHGFVFQQDTTVTPIADGTNTTKVIVAYGWDSVGDDTATLDADGSIQLGVKPDGDADTSDSTGKAELDGNGNGNGHDFMRIIASDVTNRAWDRQNQLGPTGEVFNETGHRNFGDYLNYNSYNEGRGRDTFHSAVNGSLQPTGNATFKIDASGNSFLRVASDNEFAKHTTAWRSDTPVVWLGNSQGNDAQFTELTNDYTVIGLITSTLQSDESVVLSGGAHANDKSKIKYRNHNESSWDTNLASGDSLRDAKFDATGTFDANYNAATDTYSESYSKSGDDEVQVTGHVTHIGPVTVGAVGAIGDDAPSIGAMAKTEYELLLEGIFADYDEDGGSDGGLGGGEGEGDGDGGSVGSGYWSNPVSQYIRGDAIDKALKESNLKILMEMEARGGRASEIASRNFRKVQVFGKETAAGHAEVLINVYGEFCGSVAVGVNPSFATNAIGVGGKVCAPKGGVNLFKFKSEQALKAKGWKEGDYFLRLPNQGSAAANWAQNSSRLREAMRSGKPIFDSYLDDAGKLIPTRGFLNAERELMINRGWLFNPSTGAWHPPVAP